MIKVEIKINDLDYEKVVGNMIPKVLQILLEKGEKASKLARILTGLGEIPNDMIKGALSVLPKQTKDDLVVNILTEYSQEIVSYINSLALNNNISAEIVDINIENLSISNKNY